MIKIRRLKDVAIFLQKILGFALLKVNVYNAIGRKHGNDTVKDFQKYEKLKTQVLKE